MKRLSLPTKIALVALLNFLLLVVVFLAFARAEFRFNLQSLIRTPAADGILATTGLFELELRETPVSGYPELLRRYTETHGVNFYLFSNQGQNLVGPDPHVPDAVRQRMFDPRFSGRGGGEQGAGERGAGERGRGFRGGPPSFGRGGRGGGPGSALIYVTSENPTRYWVMQRMLVPMEPEQRPAPGLLVMTSDSMLGNGFFFDPTPWIIVALAVVGISVLAWAPFLRGVTKSISQMTRATHRIADGEFEQHIETNRRDELGQLGSDINRMSVRLGGVVKGQKRFLADIAHELSSPVARMQFALGILEQRADDNQQEELKDLREELQHMSGLINELLQFSKAGMQAGEVKLTPLNVAEIVQKAVDRESVGGMDIRTDIDPSLSVLGNSEYLARALSNLVRNAIRYAGSAGPIEVSARRENENVIISVADSGPGIPEEALDDIFAPFYRPEAARNRETGGVGLGLAIVRTCVEACKGTVRARNREPRGLEVSITARSF